MKIKYLIDTILTPKLKALSFVDRYSGIVRTINIAMGNDTDKGIVKRYPISCDVDGVDCNNIGVYQNLVPDDTKKSVVYWEMISPMSNAGMTKQKNFYTKKFKGTARLVIWLNLGKLGIANCTDSFQIIPIIEKEITTKGKISGGEFDGAMLWIEPQRMVKQDINTVFGGYDYNKLKNYYLYPYDFFAIDVSFVIDQCLSKGGTFTEGTALDCVNETPSGTCYVGSTNSIPFDGVNSYIITRDLLTAYDLEATQKFSISFYIKPDAMQDGDIINKFGAASATVASGYFVRMTASGEIRVGLVADNTADKIDIKSPAILTSGNWYNVVITNDGSSTASGIKIYIDQVLQTNTVDFDGLTSSINNAGEVLKIGANITNSRYFSGLIDDVKIWNIELTEAQSKCPTNESPTSMVLYNKMGEGSLFGFLNRHFPDETGLSIGYSSQNMSVADISTDTP